MAVAHSTPPCRLLSISEASTRFNLHPNTLRNATNAGRLRCFTLPSGHRRFDEADLRKWLGRDDEQGGNSHSLDGKPIPIALCVRVSTSSQAVVQGNGEKSSIDHQEDRCREFVKEKFGGNVEVTLYKRVASGLNFEHPIFLQLMTDILAGKFRGGYLIACSFDRVCRFGIKLVEHICQLGGCQILYTMDERDAKSENETLVDDVLSILQHFTARASGNKVRKILKVNMDPASLQLAIDLQKQGWSLRRIAAKFKDENRTDEKGREYSPRVIWKNIKDYLPALELLKNKQGEVHSSSSDHQPRNTFDEFWRAKVRKRKDSVLTRRQLMEAYHSWCIDNGKDEIVDPHRLAKMVSNRGVVLKWHWRTNSRCAFGIVIKE